MSSEATESTRMLDFLAWVEVNKKKLLLGLIVLGVLAAGYSIYRWHENEVEAEANEALLKLHRPSNRSESGSSPNAQAYLQVASGYTGTGAGARALLFAGEALFRESKYSEAQTAFEKFMRDYGNSREISIAAFGVAACLDTLGKTNEAFAAYQDVITRHGNSPVAAQARLELARLYEDRNQAAQALKIYEELTRPTAQTTWSSEARVRRESLLRKYPELLRTNVVAAVSPASSLADTTNLILLATNPPAAVPPPPTKP